MHYPVPARGVRRAPPKCPHGDVSGGELILYPPDLLQVVLPLPARGRPHAVPEEHGGCVGEVERVQYSCATLLPD